jgi:hypothetical protein
MAENYNVRKIAMNIIKGTPVVTAMQAIPNWKFDSKQPCLVR